MSQLELDDVPEATAVWARHDSDKLRHGGSSGVNRDRGGGSDFGSGAALRRQRRQ